MDDILCPLLNREIAAGLCYEIAAEAHEFFKPDALKDAMRETGRTREGVAEFCAACPHFPLGS
ncbi:MAG: hypothetical protein PVI23_16185 [Maricaulaceae bacterium]